MTAESEQPFEGGLGWARDNACGAGKADPIAAAIYYLGRVLEETRAPAANPSPNPGARAVGFFTLHGTVGNIIGGMDPSLHIHIDGVTRPDEMHRFINRRVVLTFREDA